MVFYQRALRATIGTLLRGRRVEEAHRLLPPLRPMSGSQFFHRTPLELHRWVLMAYARQNMFRQVRALFDEMESSGVLAVPTAVDAKEFKLLQRLVSSVYATMIRDAFRTGSPSRAQDLFDELSARGAHYYHSWETYVEMINGLAHAGRLGQAESLFRSAVAKAERRRFDGGGDSSGGGGGHQTEANRQAQDEKVAAQRRLDSFGMYVMMTLTSPRPPRMKNYSQPHTHPAPPTNPVQSHQVGQRRCD